MNEIISGRIWRAANEYQGVAEMCLDNSKVWVAVVNASLSLEIYLKSCYSTNGNQNRKKATGHNLVKLFNNAPTKIKNLLNTKYQLRYPNKKLINEFKKYNGLFVSARYMYEAGSVKHVSSEIVDFSHDLKDIILEVADSLHKTPPEGIALLEVAKSITNATRSQF